MKNNTETKQNSTLEKYAPTSFCHGWAVEVRLIAVLIAVIYAAHKLDIIPAGCLSVEATN